MQLIDIVVIRFDTFVCTLLFKTKTILSPKYDIRKLGGLDVWDFKWVVGVRKHFLRASYHVPI